MVIGNNLKIILPTVAAVVAACVLVPTIILTNKKTINAQYVAPPAAEYAINDNDKDKDVVAMTPIVRESSPQIVFAIPPTNDVFQAAVRAFAMWDKINPHGKRDTFPLVPIYANGKLGNFAIEGFHKQPHRRGSVYYDFCWRNGAQSTKASIYLQRVSIAENAFIKSSNLPDELKSIQLYDLFGPGKENVKIINNHPITKPFTLKEVYGDRLKAPHMIDMTGVDMDAYTPNVPYENWSGRQK